MAEPAAPCPAWSREEAHPAHDWDAPADGPSRCPGWPEQRERIAQRIETARDRWHNRPEGGLTAPYQRGMSAAAILAREDTSQEARTRLLGEAAERAVRLAISTPDPERPGVLAWISPDREDALQRIPVLACAALEPLVAERERMVRIDERLKCAAACDRLGAPDVARLIRDSAA